MGLFGSIIGGITDIIGAGAQKKAANKAAAAQVQAAQMAIDEQRRQFDQTQQNFAPYLGAGTGALQQINALLGISTPASEGRIDYGAYVNANPDLLKDWQSKHSDMSIDQYGQWHYGKYGQFEPQRGGIEQYRTGQTQAYDGASQQQAAIDALKGSPLYTSLIRNGEDAILANASATGGLRGGNTQGALANFRADTLSQVINNQLANLGGIANMGQGSAGQLGTLGANAANQIGSNLNQQGQARSNAAMLNGALTAKQWNSGGDALSSILSAFAGFGGIKF